MAYYVVIYKNLLDDPLISRLSDHLFRRYVELIIYTAKFNTHGYITNVNDAAWHLRAKPEDLYNDLVELSNATGNQLIYLTTDHGWYIDNSPEKVDRNLSGHRKRLFLERGYRCEICGYTGYLELHHKHPISEGGKNNDDNLLIVCEKCHADQHGFKKKKYLDKNREHWKG